MKIVATISALVGLVAGLAVSRPPPLVVPPPIRVEVARCPPKPTPEEYRAELLAAARAVSWTCHPMTDFHSHMRIEP